MFISRTLQLDEFIFILRMRLEMLPQFAFIWATEGKGRKTLIWKAPALNNSDFLSFKIIKQSLRKIALSEIQQFVSESAQVSWINIISQGCFSNHR